MRNADDKSTKLVHEVITFKKVLCINHLKKWIDTNPYLSVDTIFALAFSLFTHRSPHSLAL